MNNKIRLLYFCSDYMVGLTQTHTEQIEYLSKQSSIDLYCVSSEKEQEEGLHKRLADTGCNIDIINDLDVHSDFKALSKKIADLIDKYDITHVNVHNNWQLALTGYIKKFSKRKFKLIYTIHGYRHNSPVKAAIAIGVIGAGLWMLADRVISMSDYVSKRFRLLGYKTDRVFYLMNKPQYNKKENHVDISKLSMVFPAQFRHGKYQDILINAVRKYIDKTGDSSIELHLPGNGPLLEDMKTLTHNLNLDKNVFFYGKLPLNDVIDLYEKGNIALCSSNVETYGRCIAEPFMLGRCVITHKTGVAGDIINHGKNGFFFNSADDLTKILCYLHENPKKIKEIADQAFIDREVFLPSNVIKSYLDCLNKA